jgi:hypothetical protein
VYTVRLEAWNCSCAAFAFSAFPGGGSEAERPWVMGDIDDDGLYGLRDSEGMGTGRRGMGVWWVGW